jgi:hypothetical protein
MTVGNYLRIAGYASLCGVLLLVVLMQPLAGLQPLVLRVPQDYSTIQAAANAAPEGATILIGPGTYVEQVTITKDLTFEGSGMGVTILEPPEPPSPLDGPNPVFTVQAPERTVTLRVRQLTVTQNTGVKVLTRASLVFEQSAWVNLLAVISAGPLERLEVRDSLFEQDQSFIFTTDGEQFMIKEIILERNRFTNGAKINLYDHLWVVGQHLIAHDNTVICDPEFLALEPQFQAGMAFGIIEENGQAGIARNTVALCENGIMVAQGVREARVVIRDNSLFTNNRNLVLNSFPEGEAYPRLDWLVEDNVIVGGGVGITTEIHAIVEGGQVRLMRNRISGQSKQYVGKVSPPLISYFGNGILLGASARQEALKEPLRIEISENRIKNNEAWGLALNLIPGLGSQPDQCNVRAPGEEQVFTDPEIAGSGNEFRNNNKGDLCPADYPWPPGFRK